MEHMEKKKKAKIAVPLKYLSNFWRSLEMNLIYCKIELSSTWIENWVLSGGENINNTGADAKLYVPIFTLSTENSVKLSKL